MDADHGMERLPVQGAYLDLNAAFSSFPLLCYSGQLHRPHINHFPQIVYITLTLLQRRLYKIKLVQVTEFQN